MVAEAKTILNGELYFSQLARNRLGRFLKIEGVGKDTRGTHR